MVYTTWNGTEWERVATGHYMRDDGVEIIKTGPKTWTLSDSLREETRHRSLRKAMYYADTV